MSVEASSQSFKEDMIAEIKRIQNELNELKNLKVSISKKSTRKPAKKTTKRKTAVKKKTVKRKPAKKTTKRRVVRRASKSKKKSRRR